MSYGNASLIYMLRCGAGVSHVTDPQVYYCWIYPTAALQFFLGEEIAAFVGSGALLGQ